MEKGTGKHRHRSKSERVDIKHTHVQDEQLSVWYTLARAGAQVQSSRKNLMRCRRRRRKTKNVYRIPKVHVLSVGHEMCHTTHLSGTVAVIIWVLACSRKTPFSLYSSHSDFRSCLGCARVILARSLLSVPGHKSGSAPDTMSLAGQSA